MIYISLTTVPRRLKYWSLVETNLISLLTQNTDKEYYVIFNIPKLYAMDDDVEYILPDELLSFAIEHPNLIINRDIYDYGPIIKIAGALRYATDPDDIIIALDDDEIYHPDMIEYSIKKLNEYPNHVICYTGDKALEKRTFIEDGVKKYSFYGTIVYFPLQEDFYVGMPGHAFSVTYKRSYFKEDFNEELWTMASGDDPLMGYYLKKHQIWPICVKWDKLTDFRPIRDECNPNPFYHFPVIKPIGFPENAGGYLIRKKYPGSIHGYQHNDVANLICNNEFKYIEKEQ